MKFYIRKSQVNFMGDINSFQSHYTGRGVARYPCPLGAISRPGVSPSFEIIFFLFALRLLTVEYSLVTKLMFTVTSLYFRIFLNGPSIEAGLAFGLSSVCLSVYTK